MKKMKKEVFTLKRLEKELGQSRQNITRRLDRLGIKAINEDTREYKTQPLHYDNETFIILSKEFDVLVSASEDTSKDISNEEVSVSKEELMIKQIEQLKADKKRLEEKLDKSEDRHEKQLSDANELTKRQQELNMKDRLKIEDLESRLRISNVSDPIQDADEEDVKEEIEPEDTKDNRTLWQRILNK